MLDISPDPGRYLAEKHSWLSGVFNIFEINYLSSNTLLSWVQSRKHL